jgi:hypothetical protein
MTPPVDPWRTLGLPPGSTADEVRRAYRRLAKANHPDAAGEVALPRFLATQAAYEHLTGGRTRGRPGARPTAGGAAPDERAREPWRADPERARASGRADRRRPGSRPASGPSGSARPGPGTTNGPAPDGGGAGRERTSGRTNQSAGASSTQEPRSRRSGRTRPPKKATPYSTSYDAAEDEPFEPGWSGATWYGASSGTYWTINPKEYADPRKHGPEYQRRARRNRSGWILDDEPGPEPGDGRDPTPEPDDPSPAASAEAGPGSEAAAGAAGAPSGTRPGRSWTDARGHAGAGGRRPPAPPFRFGDELDAAPEPSPIQRLPRIRPPRTLSGRLVAAIFAWPLVGGLLSVAVQESSGCGRFAASCPALSAPGTWLLLVAILVLLIALPRVASWLVTGSIAAFVAGAAAAVALSAGGGTALPDVSAPILGSVVIVAYVAGVIYAIVLDRLDGRTRRVP